jgi:hypothetical protein
MKPGVLLIITSDPRSSHRPAEAIRIAAGVGTWERVEVAVYLHGAAVLALSDCTDALVDGDNYAQYLPMVAGFPRPIYVQESGSLLAEVRPSPVRFEEISIARLAALAAASHYVMRF